MKQPISQSGIMWLWRAIIVAVMLMAVGMPVARAEEAPVNDSAQILQAFNKQHSESEHAKAITDKDKQRIMFLIGVALFVLVMLTGGLGIAMGIYGKQVYVPHMICAGLSVTLAIVHAIVGLVWFYPF